MGSKRCPNLFRFRCTSANNAVKWMVKPPTFIFRRAGWLGAYARVALEGGTYHPICVQLACMM